MTVASQTSHVEYTCNGATVNFAVPFRFLEDTHLAVYLKVLATGVRSLLTLDSDYTVSGANENDGGTVTTSSTYSSAYEIDIERAVPITQETDYEPNDPFPAEAHEDALDKLTMICQQLAFQGEILQLTIDEIEDDLSVDVPNSRRYQSWAVACSDRSTPLTATAKVGRFRLPYDFTIVGVMADLGTAQASGNKVTIDVNKNGVSILSTKITIDNNETTSITAAIAAVLSSTICVAGDEITFDIDDVDGSTAACWLQSTVYGYQT